MICMLSARSARPMGQRARMCVRLVRLRVLILMSESYLYYYYFLSSFI